MAYRRFRHMQQDKVTMDFAFFAIAFNLKKMCAKLAKAGNMALLYSIMILFRLVFAQYARMGQMVRRRNEQDRMQTKS